MKNSLADGVDGCDVERDSYELTGGTHWTAGSDETGGELGEGAGSNRSDADLKTDSSREKNC